ncbi:MAG: sulfurtransferase [Spirochaetaceae bacterium]|nr:MAG: sulfurtransferase [Spirochaetaceae bacterium]
MKKQLIVIASAVVVAAAIAVGVFFAVGGGSAAVVRTAPEDILVSPEWVQERSGDVVIFDIGRSFDDYAEGHVPGAAWVDRSIIAATVDGVSNVLPDPAVVAADLEELGLRADTPVVVYDAGAGTWSSRLFWALEYIGHEQVHLLDGGFATWSATGAEVSTEIALPQRGEFTANVRDSLLASFEEVVGFIDSDSALILDARSPDEFAGTDVRAARGGHIPGSVNIDWANNRGDEGLFLSIEQLAAVYRDALDGRNGPAITLCQGGFRAAHSYVALRVLGHEDARMYDGSWAEWGNREDAPISQGVN